MLVQSLGPKDPVEKEMATHSRILAWRIPWTEEHGGVAELDTTEETQHACTFTQILVHERPQQHYSFIIPKKVETTQMSFS